MSYTSAGHFIGYNRNKEIIASCQCILADKFGCRRAIENYIIILVISTNIILIYFVILQYACPTMCWCRALREINREE